MSETGDEKQQGGRSNEVELATRQVQIQSKRFYIDVKENKRGRFIKLAEVGVGGRKSRIIMSFPVADEFKTRLGEFSEIHSNMGPSHGTETNNRENDGLLKSETINKDRKRYYLDLKENQRGRFLRVSMVMSRGPRAQIAIPAQGLIQFKDQLVELLDQYATAETAASNENDKTQPLDTSESKSLKGENKTFYFDSGSNNRGSFLRITEVRQRYRRSITVPDKLFEQFKNMIGEFSDKMKEGEQLENSAPATTEN
jgi:transcriptional activator protein Pur-alpha